VLSCVLCLQRPSRFLAIDSINKRHLSTSEKRGLRKGPSGCTLNTRIDFMFTSTSWAKAQTLVDLLLSTHTYS
jgi:hypothetical protein